MTVLAEADAPSLRLLGPVRLENAGQDVPIRSSLIRTLLAVLALSPRAPRDPWLLVEELWGEGLPSDPKGSLHVQVTKLRRWLGAAGAPSGCLRFDPAGYVLDLPRAAVDLHRFCDVAETLPQEVDPRQVVERSEQALSLWEGPSFGGCVPGVELDAEAVRLDELRIQVEEARCEALVAMGRHETAATVLIALLSRHPARERLAELAALTLYRQGRQPEALDVIRRTRGHLLEEYGLDPGPELSRLEEHILAQDPTLDHPSPARFGRVRARLSYDPGLEDGITPDPAPVGRSDLVSRLLDVLDDGGVAVLTGPAGIGKSTVLAALAEAAAPRQARVVGATWGPDPTPLAAWSELASLLGADPSTIRSGPGCPAARVRALLSAQLQSSEILVTLDDAHLADSASLALLRDLARAGLPSGVAIVVAARGPRSEPAGEWSEAHGDLFQLEDVLAVEIGPLLHDDVEALVGARLDPLGLDASEVAELVAVMWTRTGGHPLHLRTMLELLAAEQDVAGCRRTAMAVPAQLRPLLEHQLNTLPTAARDALDALAVLGPLPSEDIARYCSSTPLEVSRALRSARDLGIVTEDDATWELRHDLIRDVVLAQMPESVSRYLHHSRYGELSKLPADPFDTLRHAVGAGPLLEVGTEVDVRLAASNLAYQRGAYHESLQILRPIRSRAAGPARLATLLQLGLAHAALGQLEEADALLGAVVTDPGADENQVVAAAVGDEPLGMRVGGDLARHRRLVDAEERTRGRSDSLRLGVLGALLAEGALGAGQQNGEGLWSEFGGLAATLSAPEDRVVVATTLGPRLVEGGDVAALLASAEDAYEAAQASSDPSLTLSATRLLVRAALASGDIDRAVDLRWAMDRGSQRAARPVIRWSARVTDAALRLAAGDDTAQAEAEAALELGASHGIPDAFGTFAVFLLTQAWMSGTTAALVGPIEDAIRTYPDVPAWGAAAAVAFGSAGDMQRSRRYLDDFVERRDPKLPQPFDRSGLCLAITAAAKLQAADAAAALRGALQPDPGAVVTVGGVAAVFGPVDLHVGLAEAQLGHWEAARALLFGAAHQCAEAGWHPWHSAAVFLCRRYLGEEPPEPAPTGSPVTLGL